MAQWQNLLMGLRAMCHIRILALLFFGQRILIHSLTHGYAKSMGRNRMEGA